LIENGNLHMSPDTFNADMPVASEEDFINGVYSSVDEATACLLDRLRIEEGILPSCKMGCCHCCRYHILTNIVEAHALGQYIKRKFSTDQINGLRIRTQQWHAWDNSRPGRYPLTDIDEQTTFSNYDHCCPLLVNGACSAYPVRPVVCRTHFVTSHPLFCCTASDPAYREDAPVVLRSVKTAALPFSMAIRNHIENAGLDFSRSIMLLPHWLATEMGWDFDISV
jgi:Fe-S-cluster containining protein